MRILVVSLCVYTDIKASEDINTLSINQSYRDINVPVYRCIVAFAYTRQFLSTEEITFYKLFLSTVSP